MIEKRYEKELYDKHYKEQIKRYTGRTSRAVYEYWDSKLLSLLDLKEDDVVLDYGCGIGTLTNKIYSKTVVGVDLSKNLIHIARREGTKGFFIIGDAENLPFKENAFNKIIGRGILHHLQRPDKGVRELMRVISPPGKIVLSEPNERNLLIRFVRSLLKLLNPSYSKEQEYFKADHLQKMFLSPKVIYFGYFSYPFGFPDLIPISLPSPVIKFLIRIDEWISRIPFVNTMSWQIFIEKLYF